MFSYVFFFLPGTFLRRGSAHGRRVHAGRCQAARGRRVKGNLQQAEAAPRRSGECTHAHYSLLFIRVSVRHTH